MLLFGKGQVLVRDLLDCKYVRKGMLNGWINVFDWYGGKTGTVFSI